MKRRTMFVLLVLMLSVSTLLSACTSSTTPEANKPTETQKPNNETKTDPPTETAAKQEFRFNIGTEPPSLDPGLAQDVTSSTILSATFEGLTSTDQNSKVIPGVAEKWDISPDGKKYTFTLRQNAKWSNGDPVTAHDFEYAWKRVLDPNLPQTSPYNYQLYYIKNGEAYFTKKITDPNQIGVKATGDYTLEVELENPTPYFLDLTAFATYFPIHKSAKDNPAWANEANTLISNGPLKVSSWAHSSQLELVPNEHYHKRDEIKLTKVTAVMIEDTNAILNMYETNALDYIGPPTNGGIPSEQIPILQQTKKDEIAIKPLAASYYYLFNNKQKPFDNKKVRKALALAINRQLITEKITLSGQQPAFGIVPPGINIVNDEYRNQVDGNYFKEDIAEAQKLLAEGLKESGLDKVPAFTLIYNTNDLHKKVAQAVADMWKQNLNIDVKLQNIEWTVFLDQRSALDYSVARAGWNPDYNDPMTFLDLYTTGSGNNDIGFSNKKYDDLVKAAKKEVDLVKRRDLLASAEKILIEEEMAILPIYYNATAQLLKPNIKNVYVDPLANFHFARGYVE
ncbi:peptide ABC transporter substrate-binding protein [Paenibacillus agilis]|uniref:Peptide ABC transporter substrate-binding protein n=1 Tax=Paenibacillus agilis TaxID=3020863 RepID=A0A559IWI7_9BACL|nr:peptide ABC transporter substrate-binding protein [Paenibacillus agilis]TVX91983.1 peptide ABC transporter substrate-binding protein [Paenibacillus agilis]